MNDAPPRAIRAARFFLDQAEIGRITPLGEGNVNDTYLVRVRTGADLVLQRLNPAVFPDPPAVIRNTRLVTERLHNGVAERPELAGRFIPLRMISGPSADFWTDPEGGAWRLLNMIPGQTRSRVTTGPQAEELGRTLGLFHCLLAPLDPARLSDPLPGFHDLTGYLNRYAETLATTVRPEDPLCRDFIDARRDSVALSCNGEPDPGRAIIHGDPKVGNFLFAAQGERVISLIDLDTVRAGPLLHDLGDALRSCCNPAGEQPGRPEQARFNPDLFHHWLSGYRGEAAYLLTETDEQRIVDAVRLIAFELGLRFYTDHLAGNRYFKVNSPDQNLERARTQFHLVRSIEEQAEELNDIVQALTRAR